MSTDPAAPTAATVADDKTMPIRSNSLSEQSRTSDDSQTAAEFIRDQELLEADAREALPYSIESCTKILGPLRQNIFACLTCNPAPTSPEDEWTPAGICYACSVQCHGEHQLVEIFQKRDFTCDCGTTRLPSTSPCALRINSETNTKGGVHSEEASVDNKYNHNFRNLFCCCACDYDPFQQKGTMFQCLGLGTHETGGCGEDWYHPGCLVGMGPRWYEKMDAKPSRSTITANSGLATISEGNEGSHAATTGDDALEDVDEDPPMPPGFPEEDDFEGFLCYKCIEANPWIKRYAGADGFLAPVFTDQTSKKRKADGDEQGESKRIKSEGEGKPLSDSIPAAEVIEEERNQEGEKEEEKEEKEEEKKEGDKKEEEIPTCNLLKLPPPPLARFSLFFKDGFREKLCRCSDCYPKLRAHPQLLDEEDVYEPPLSDAAGSEHGGSTVGSGSLLERGESALRNVDRVRAIEGVMAYNHLKERLKPFFQEFAESGKAIGAEDIKAYFAKLRGDERGIKEAGEAAVSAKDNDDEDGRREQRGY